MSVEVQFSNLGRSKVPKNLAGDALRLIQIRLVWRVFTSPCESVK